MEAARFFSQEDEIKFMNDRQHETKTFAPKEWTSKKQWNQFNSFKLLAHIDRWKYIRQGGGIPAPVLITVDPANVCNLKCAWCNARYIRNQRNRMLSEKVLFDLADFLPHWGENGVYEPGVKAICVAGGGEPLLNPATGAFIEKTVKNGIEVGVVTNGTKINDFISELNNCTWVGCSVDAATDKTFNKLKGMPEDAVLFSKIIDNIANLTDYARSHVVQLGKNRPSYGVCYKYLLYKENIGEIYAAAKLAKSIGCKSIHFRPAGTSWDKLGTDEEILFNEDEIRLFKEQISEAQELDDENFGVFGVTHKFNANFGRANTFDRCYAVFMTAVISPPQNPNASADAFTMGLCCDRRGDEQLELLRDCEKIDEINKVWGGKKHWQIYDSVDVSVQCPRCTYKPHNEIYQEVILNDSMTYKFI